MTEQEANAVELVWFHDEKHGGVLTAMGFGHYQQPAHGFYSGNDKSSPREYLIMESHDPESPWVLLNNVVSPWKYATVDDAKEFAQTIERTVILREEAELAGDTDVVAGIDEMLASKRYSHDFSEYEDDED